LFFSPIEMKVPKMQFFHSSFVPLIVEHCYCVFCFFIWFCEEIFISSLLCMHEGFRFVGANKTDVHFIVSCDSNIVITYSYVQISFHCCVCDYVKTIYCSLKSQIVAVSVIDKWFTKYNFGQLFLLHYFVTVSKYSLL
jgi:hypothetical protein